MQQSHWYADNLRHLEHELTWITALIHQRVQESLLGQDEVPDLLEAAMPEFTQRGSPYADFVTSLGLAPAERVLLMLTLLPHLRPSALDPFLVHHVNEVPVTDYGGARGQTHKGFLPTLETAIFLIAGRNLDLRIQVTQLVRADRPLFTGKWLRLEQGSALEPHASSMLVPSRELLEFITTGDMGEPEFGASFPAQKLESSRSWDDLILAHETLGEVQDILSWIEHEHTVMKGWGLGSKVMPGFRALFYGPPGTGKTFTATLLGQATGREVYRIDLSMVVSKYIGETEKNLRNVFDKAESRNWILFFDEADALFGKRTDISDSKDRYANQEVSYLLQRVETFDGVVILATNSRDNLDKAFTRRFQAVVNFPMPSSAERIRIWTSAIPAMCTLDAKINLQALSDKYELAGGSIMNVVRHCALRAAKRGSPVIFEEDFLDGIRKEYRKSGRILN
jgi:hypothetical protein